MPAGYELVTAGRGTELQEWGEDCCGTAEPFTVLAPPGEGTESAEAIVVSVTGFAGYEGGLDQASSGYSVEERSETFTVDGQEAIFTPAETSSEWADLVVARGDDLAVRVAGRNASRSRLVEVLDRVRPPTTR
ncbi:MAG: hypothetical protein WKF43_10705 [Acidimicrobiales bacterium]